MAKNRSQEQSSEIVQVQETVKPTVVDHSNCKKGCVKGMIFSRIDYAVPVKYKGETLMVSPRGKVPIDHYDLLEQPLPKGITARKIS